MLGQFGPCLVVVPLVTFVFALYGTVMPFGVSAKGTVAQLLASEPHQYDRFRKSRGRLGVTERGARSRLAEFGRSWPEEDCPLRDAEARELTSTAPVKAQRRRRS